MFTGVRPGGHRVHSGSVGSLECALDVVGVIRVDLDHCSAHMGASRLSGVAGFTGVHLHSRRVHPGSLGSLECALGVAGLIQSQRIHCSTP